MATATVIQSEDGLYRLGYFSADNSKFYVIDEFVNGSMADAIAHKMNSAIALGQKLEARNGR